MMLYWPDTVNGDDGRLGMAANDPVIMWRSGDPAHEAAGRNWNTKIKALKTQRIFAPEIRRGIAGEVDLPLGQFPCAKRQLGKAPLNRFDEAPPGPL